MATRDDVNARLFSRSFAGFGARPRHLAHIKDLGPISDDHDETTSTATSGSSELGSSTLNDQAAEKPQRTENVKSGKQQPPPVSGRSHPPQKSEEGGGQHRGGDRKPRDVVDRERRRELSRGDSSEEKRATIRKSGKQKSVEKGNSSSITKPSSECRLETRTEDNRKDKHRSESESVKTGGLCPERRISSEDSKTVGSRLDRQKSHESNETPGIISEDIRTEGTHRESRKSNEGRKTSSSKSESSKTRKEKSDKAKREKDKKKSRSSNQTVEPSHNLSSASGKTGQKSGAADNNSSERKLITELPESHSDSVRSEAEQWAAHQSLVTTTQQSTPAQAEGNTDKSKLGTSQPGLDKETIDDNKQQSNKTQKTSSGETRTKSNFGEKPTRQQKRTPIKDRPKKPQEEVESSPEVHSKPKRPNRKRDSKNTEQSDLTEILRQLEISPIKNTLIFTNRNFVVEDWHDSLNDPRTGPVGAETSSEELIACLDSEFDENVQIMEPSAPPSGVRHSGISSRGRGRPTVSKMALDPNNNADNTFSTAHQKRPSDSDSEVAPPSRRFCGEIGPSNYCRPMRDMGDARRPRERPVIARDDEASGSVFHPHSEPTADYLNTNVPSPNRPTTFAYPSGVTPLRSIPTPPREPGWQRTPSPYSGSSGSSPFATPPEPPLNRKALGHRAPVKHLFADEYELDERGDSSRGFSPSSTQANDCYQASSTRHYDQDRSRNRSVPEHRYDDAGHVSSRTDTQTDRCPDYQQEYVPWEMEPRVWSPQEIAYGPRYPDSYSSSTRREAAYPQRSYIQEDPAYDTYLDDDLRPGNFTSGGERRELFDGRGELYQQYSVPGRGGRPMRDPSPRRPHHAASTGFGISDLEMFRQPPPPPPPLPPLASDLATYNRTLPPHLSRLLPDRPPPLEDSRPVAHGTVRAALGRGRGRPREYTPQDVTERSQVREPQLCVSTNMPGVRILRRGEDLPQSVDAVPEHLPALPSEDRDDRNVYASPEHVPESEDKASSESENDENLNDGIAAASLLGLSADSFSDNTPAFVEVPQVQPLLDAFGRVVSSDRLGECIVASRDDSISESDDAEGTGHECLASAEESEDTDSRAYLSANETLSPKPPSNRSFERTAVSIKSQVSKVSSLVHDSTPANSLENESYIYESADSPVDVKTSIRPETSRVDSGRTPGRNTPKTSPAPPGFSPLDIIKENYYSEDSPPPPPGFKRHQASPVFHDDLVDETEPRREIGRKPRPVVVHKFVTLSSKTPSPSPSISSIANRSPYSTSQGTSARTPPTYSESWHKQETPPMVPRVYDMNYPALSAAGIKTAPNSDPKPRLVQSAADFPWAPASQRNKYGTSNSTQRRSWGSIGQKDYSPLLKTDVSPVQRASSNESLEFIHKESPKRDWKLLHRYRLDSSNVPYIDSHCHIDFLFNRTKYQGSWTSYQQENADTFMNNYAGCVTNFCDPNSYKATGKWTLLLQEDNVWGAFGCHPKSVGQFTPEKEMFLRKIISNPKVVALGEIGLDYSGRFKEQSEQQKEAFVKQLDIALKYQKPLVIHCRQAEADCLQIMKKYVPHDWPIHRHCFTDDWNTARPWMDYFTNCYIGLTPLVTYKNAKEVHEVAVTVPLERLLLETDAPYFVPYYVSRSQMLFSTPGMAICVADEVARLRACDFDDVLRHARSNTKKMYGV